MTLPALGMIVVVLITAWTFGGIALRFGGGLVFWVGLVGLVVTGDRDGLLVAFLGALAWLAGRGHRILRHGAAGTLGGPAFGEAISLGRLSIRVRRRDPREGLRR